MYTKYIMNIYKITIVFNGRKMFDIVSRIKKNLGMVSVITDIDHSRFDESCMLRENSVLTLATFLPFNVQVHMMYNFLLIWLDENSKYL